MKEQYAELLKRHSKELENLAGTRFVDIEKLQKMGRPYAEIKDVHDRYQKEQQQMIVRHGKEKEAFFKTQEQGQGFGTLTAEMLKKYRENKSRDQERGHDGHER